MMNRRPARCGWFLAVIAVGALAAMALPDEPAPAPKAGYQPTWAFNIGPAGSPVRPGFVAVTPESAYSPEARFGWKSSKELVAVTVPAARESTYNEYRRANVPPPVYYNELTQSCIGSAEPAEFLVDLKPGKYEMYLLAGFSDKFPLRFVRFQVAVGDAAPRTISIPQKYIFENPTIPFEVKAGALSIKLQPETAWVLDAMIIYPAADRDKAHAELIAPIEQEIYLLPPDLWAKRTRVPNPKQNPAPEPTADDVARGYILFSRGYVHNVFPDSAPVPAEIVKEVATFAAPGRYEPLTVEIYPLKPLEDIQVRASDLKSADGVIPSSAMDLRMVRAWFTRPQYQNIKNYEQTPEILDPVAPRSLAARECQRYWITVKVPDDARPGLYTGAIEFAFDNAPAAQMPIRFEVLPFKLLDDPAKSFGMYYYDPRDKIEPGDGPAVRDAITERARLECVDMREHGMNTIELGGLKLKTIVKKQKYEVDYAGLDQNIKWYRSNGALTARSAFLSFDIVETPYADFMGAKFPKHIQDISLGPPEYYDIVTDLVKQVEAARKTHPDWPEFYYYPIDEANNKGIPFLVRMLQAIKAVPGVKTYVTQGIEAAASRPLDPYVNVWCSGRFTINFDLIKAALDKGQIFWCYPNFVACSHHVVNGGRMTYGFGFWRSEYSCLIPWHYQAPNGNPFDDFDDGDGDWCEAYPGPNGPLPTERWETTRQGINDYRFIYTLETLIGRAEKSGKATQQARAAKEYLKGIWDSMEPQRQYAEAYDTQTGRGLWNFDQYQAARRTIADHILAIGKEIGFAP